MTNAPGAAGNVPYRKPNVLKSVVSVKLEPELVMFTVCLMTSGRTNLLIET
jgi:hypothetical protein